MQKAKYLSILAAGLSIFFAGKAALGETISVPNGSAVIVVPPKQKQQPTVVWTLKKGQTMEQAMKAWQKLVDDESKWQDEINKDYERVKNAPAPNPAGDFEPSKDSGPFAQTAKECGEAKQRECAPSKFGGRTMCGLSVAKMIKCMAPSIGGGAGCSGGCGNGKDFVACSNGQMAKCGYAKIQPTDPRCKKAGAVLSYTQSPTTRGKKYGHVEFVCGDNKYCSIYRAPHDRPWPRTPADACWFPKSSESKK